MTCTTLTQRAWCLNHVLVVGHGVAPAISTGERNSPGENFTWLHPPEDLSRAAVELPGDGIEVSL